jgi:hypothetical protein
VAFFAIHILVSTLKRPGRGEMIKAGTEGRLSMPLPDGQDQKCQTREER